MPHYVGFRIPTRDVLLPQDHERFSSITRDLGAPCFEITTPSFLEAIDAFHGRKTTPIKRRLPRAGGGGKLMRKLKRR